MAKVASKFIHNADAEHHLVVKLPTFSISHPEKSTIKIITSKIEDDTTISSSKLSKTKGNEQIDVEEPPLKHAKQAALLFKLLANDPIL